MISKSLYYSLAASIGFFGYLKVEDSFRYRLSDNEKSRIAFVEKDFDKDKARNALPYEYSAVFDSIGRNYVEGKHVCKDMTQEWSDWLISQGVSHDNIRLVMCDVRENKSLFI